MPAMLETRPRKVLYHLTRTKIHLETLEAQKTAYRQALVKILFHLWNIVALYPPQKPLCRLTSAVKLLTHLVVKKLRMGRIS